jgi:hypothetical protein
VDEDKDEVDVVDCNGIGGVVVVIEEEEEDADRVGVDREGGDVGGDGWRV